MFYLSMTYQAIQYECHAIPTPQHKMTTTPLPSLQCFILILTPQCVSA